MNGTRQLRQLVQPELGEPQSGWCVQGCGAEDDAIWKCMHDQ